MGLKRATLKIYVQNGRAVFMFTSIYEQLWEAYFLENYHVVNKKSCSWAIEELLARGISIG
jgi:hypothetical protein|uniref:Uncharacterized protein n=1 Tax=Populus trichocarpa TaxID=3694 RepID=B9HJM8_POPTR